MELNDSVVRHLREVVDLPDLSATRFSLEREIGRGGLGVVYAARDRDLDRLVALKVMDAALGGEPRLIALANEGGGPDKRGQMPGPVGGPDGDGREQDEGEHPADAANGGDESQPTAQGPETFAKRIVLEWRARRFAHDALVGRQVERRMKCAPLLCRCWGLWYWKPRAAAMK